MGRVLAVSTLVAALVSGCGERGGADRSAGNGEGTVPPGRAGSADRGRALYAAHCAQCHGEQGEGRREGNATALNNQDFLAVASDELLMRTIAEGRPGTAMTAWTRPQGGPLTDGQIGDVVAFLRSWQTVPPRPVRSGVVAGNATRGAELYAINCANCHGREGRGDLGMGPAITNPAFLAVVSDGFLWATIARGRRDTPMFLSLRRLDGVRQLTEADINDLVAYLRSYEPRRWLERRDRVEPSGPRARGGKP